MIRSIFLFIAVLSLNIFAFESKRPEEAMKYIYPSANIEVKNLVISKDMMEKLEKNFSIKLNSRMVTFYIAKKDGKVVGYGYVDIHTVRTKPEAVLYTIIPDGKIEVVEVLAFHEPLEYLPDERWFKQFSKKDESNLKFKKDIQNVTGATLTSRAITENAKKVLLLWKIFFGEGI